MSDMNGNPVQVVRPLREGETLPCFSTLDLLLGAGSFSVKTPTRKPGPSKGTIHAGTLITAQGRTKRAKALYEKHFETVKAMLSDFATNDEIAQATGITVSQVGGAIRKYDELKQLSGKRVSIRNKRGGEIIAARSRQRFADQRAEICEMLKTTGVNATASHFKFDHRMLKRYLEEGKNAS